MSRFYMSFKNMLRDYAVDLTVYPYSSPKKQKHYHYVGGVRVQDDDDQTTTQPVQRREPVVPPSDSNSLMSEFMSGGELTQVDLLWISTELYPIGTVVDVPSQGGKYRVINLSNFHDYSDVVVYELKGDDEHPDGK